MSDMNVDNSSLFNRFDVNQDGVLDKDEVNSAHEKYGVNLNSIHEDMNESLFKQKNGNVSIFDSNIDGIVDVNEQKEEILGHIKDISESKMPIIERFFKDDIEYDKNNEEEYIRVNKQVEKRQQNMLSFLELAQNNILNKNDEGEVKEIERINNNDGTHTIKYDDGSERTLNKNNLLLSIKMKDETTINYEYYEDGSYKQTWSDGIIIKIDSKNRTIYSKEKDNLERTIEYYEDGGYQETWSNGDIYKYDSKERIIYKKYGKTGEEQKTEFNEDGSYTDIWSDGSVYKYDSSERMIYGKDAKTGKITTTEYLEDGSYTEKISDGNTLKYDKDGNLVYFENNERFKYFGEEKQRILFNTYLDEKGRPTKGHDQQGSEFSVTYNDDHSLSGTKDFNGKNIEFKMTKDGECFVNIDNKEYKLNIKSDKIENTEKFFSILMTVTPINVLLDLINEDIDIIIGDIKDNRSFMSENPKKGEFIKIDPDNLSDMREILTEDNTIVHEIGHVVDHVYNYEKDYDFSDIEAFRNAFEEGIKKYEAAGHKKHEEEWNEKEKIWEEKYCEEGDYCTNNQNDMFAECYAYIQLGYCQSMDIIDKYFQDNVGMTISIMSEVRNNDKIIRNKKMLAYKENMDNKTT